VRYNFTDGPTFVEALELWRCIDELTPNGLSNDDKVSFCFMRELVTIEEVNMIREWLTVFGGVRFA